jgi:hypothetical protein
MHPYHSEEVNVMEPDSRDQEHVPVGQVVFDELFLFFMISLVISFVVYNVWGLMDLLGTPALVP